MLDVQALRLQFPALQHQRDGITPIFLDGPAGTQTPQRTILSIVKYLSTTNANHGGAFVTSEESDYILDKAREWTANFLNAPSADEIVFGANMTTLTLHLSRSIARVLKPGDEVIVTRLDHDANIRPWQLAAEDSGATLRWVDVNEDDCTLNIDDLNRQLSDKTRLVAVTCASNLVGSLVDVAEVCRLAHDAGAWVFLDCVHYAPHRLIDVKAWDCDFLVCSPYKFFGPHLGVLWGKREQLESLSAYKVRPAPESLPGCWMTGTQNHECIAGLAGTLDYLLDVGAQHLGHTSVDSDASLRREKFASAMEVFGNYEQRLSRSFLERMRDRPQFRVWGIDDPARSNERVPTFAVTHSNRSPDEMAHTLGGSHIYSWNGNSYAVELSERLGLESNGGVLRLGFVHYNTNEEMDRLFKVLDKMQ